MPELSQGPSELDTRLAEIDRKLRAIQADLDPNRGTAPSEPESESEPIAPQGDADDATPPGQTAPVQPPEPDADSLTARKTETEPHEEDGPDTEHRGRSGPLAAVLQAARERQREPEPEPAPEPQLPPEPAPFPEPAPAPEPMPSPLPPAAALPTPPPPPAPALAPAGNIAALTEMHSKLVSAMRELLDAYGLTLQHLPPAGPAVPASEVSMSAGPFTSTASVRRFEQELAAMPGVREVAVRGYEGENRALFDVQLGDS